MQEFTEYRSFIDALPIKPQEIISIVGAGGKTSLLFRLAKELGESGLKVLVTTTTKMKVPVEEQYDFIDLGSGLIDKTVPLVAGRYYLANVNEIEGKVEAVNPQYLKHQIQRFDVTVIEADGAAMKSLKGWNRGEPVIPEYVTMTVGVVDVSTVNQVIDEKLVHRLELFTGITSSKPGDKVSVEHLIRLINHADGLFRNSRGRKVLYLNKVEGQSALLTASRIRDNFDGIVVAGSILEKVWFA